MTRRKAKSSKSPKERDHDKEVLFRVLVSVLEAGGYQVRREELKRGPSWSVHSGACRALGQRLIFVDRRMSQDDQIALLSSYLTRLNLFVAPADVEKLPEKLRRRIEALIGEPCAEVVVEAAA